MLLWRNKKKNQYFWTEKGILSRVIPLKFENAHLLPLIYVKTAGPSCSKLTMSLVKDSLKFTSSDRQIC